MCDLINLKSGNWSGKYIQQTCQGQYPPIYVFQTIKSLSLGNFDDLKYVSALNEELKEETKEYLADNSIDELAYIIGVIEALAITKGSNLDEVWE